MRASRRPTARLAGMLLASLLLACCLAGGAAGASLAQRTGLISGAGSADGASANPSLAAGGRYTAFDSAATNLVASDPNGAVRDVFLFDSGSGTTTLLSRAADGGGADGPSGDPAADASGDAVVFASAATNLVASDANRASDVFLARGGSIRRISLAAGGAEGAGASDQPDVGADGLTVAFTSAAANLVPGDTNDARDVFVRDLDRNTTVRVSVATGGVQSDGPSSAPAVSADGRFVSFASEASNLVRGDVNGRQDVFVHDLRTGRTERASVSSAGREQSKAVIRPFTQISDISADGRYVTFDSDASNLVARDRNKRTDVFVRDRKRHRTFRASLDSTGHEGNNDSFAPTITPDGRYVAFQSFAGNLAPGDSPTEDVFVRDLGLAATSVADVAADGSPAQRRRGPQILQQVAIADTGEVVAFVSRAANLVAGDVNGRDDLFMRVMTPPATSLLSGPGAVTRSTRPRVAFGADDPRAESMLCRLGGLQQLCPSRFRFGRLAAGKHVVTARAGGPGFLFDPKGARLAFTIDREGPRVKARRSKKSRAGTITLTGTARDDGFGVKAVEVAVGTVTRAGCRAFDGKRYVKHPCTRPKWIRADGTGRWTLTVPRTSQAFYGVLVRAVDRGGNRGSSRTLTFVTT